MQNDGRRQQTNEANEWNGMATKKRMKISRDWHLSNIYFNETEQNISLGFCISFSLRSIRNTMNQRRMNRNKNRGNKMERKKRTVDTRRSDRMSKRKKMRENF